MALDPKLMEKLFDTTVPDWAFLTLEETCKAFGVEQATLYTWRKSKDFPEPTTYPGCSGYPIGVLRSYLKESAACASKAFKKKLASATP